MEKHFRNSNPVEELRLAGRWLPNPEELWLPGRRGCWTMGVGGWDRDQCQPPGGEGAA